MHNQGCNLQEKKRYARPPLSTHIPTSRATPPPQDHRSNPFPPPATVPTLDFQSPPLPPCTGALRNPLLVDLRGTLIESQLGSRYRRHLAPSLTSSTAWRSSMDHAHAASVAAWSARVTDGLRGDLNKSGIGSPSCMCSFINLRYLPAGITILQFVYRIELSFIMFSVQNPAALEGPRGFFLLHASEHFPVRFVKGEGLVFTETLTHCSVTYIHDPLQLGICLF
jgi:hypothetical protein